MAALLRDALPPNLVQTLAARRRWCMAGRLRISRMAATAWWRRSSACQLADVVVTEAGFGADLGAEKFLDIKCRSAGLAPDAAWWWPPCAR